MVTRREFLKTSALASGVLLVPSTATLQQVRPPALDAAVVNEFVKVAHFDLPKVKEMLGVQPHLLNATWDWGNGDFETAMGAAGHMGLKETALYLMEKGARADIFVLTMLGKTAIVKTMIADYPNLIDAIGPHGFTLLHHAKQGKADELFEYFSEKGLKDLHRKVFY